MRIKLLILFVSISLSLQSKSHDPVAVKGLLDLRHVNREQFLVKLDGEWEFYWKKILRPNDFKVRTQIPDYYGKVPSYWTDYPDKSVKTEKYGYATYRLTVLLPAGYKTALGIDMPV